MQSPNSSANALLASEQTSEEGRASLRPEIQSHRSLTVVEEHQLLWAQVPILHTVSTSRLYWSIPPHANSAFSSPFFPLLQTFDVAQIGLATLTYFMIHQDQTNKANRLILEGANTSASLNQFDGCLVSQMDPVG